MKKLLTACVLSMTVALPAMAQEQRNLVTVLTAPEPQTQLMAMVLTMNAVQQGATAQILLCGPAGDIALKEAPASVTAGQPPRDASPQGLMRMMMDKHNVKVEVCAIYLPGKRRRCDNPVGRRDARRSRCCGGARSWRKTPSSSASEAKEMPRMCGIRGIYQYWLGVSVSGVRNGSKGS